MKIKIPNKFIGKPIAGAMEGVLAREPKQEEPTQNAPSQEGYIFVPSLGLEVAKKRTLQGINFDEQQKTAHSQKERFCSIQEFREFVKYLRTDYTNKQEARRVLDEIYKGEGDWRAENLDARFEKVKNKFYINYYKFDANRAIVPVYEPLVSCLMKDKTPGISLDDWINNATSQGLPLLNAKSGDLSYWAPVDSAVAWFGAYSGRALLYCDGDAGSRGGALGVRLVREAGAKNLRV